MRQGRPPVNRCGSQVDHGPGVRSAGRNQLPDYRLPGSGRAVGQRAVEVEQRIAAAEGRAANQQIAGQNAEVRAIAAGVQQFHNLAVVGGAMAGHGAAAVFPAVAR